MPNNMEARVSGHESGGPSTLGEKLLEHARFPRNSGVLGSPSGRAEVVGSCGDSIEVSIRVENTRIAEVNALPHGCLFTVACASAMTQLAKGISLEKGLELLPEEVAGVLGGLPEDHLHCARMAINALHEAIGDHYGRNRADAASSPSFQRSLEPPGGKMMLKILLVSSEPKNLEAFSRALALDPRVSLIHTGSGDDALKIAGSEHPNLVVLDSAITGKALLKLVAELLAVDAMINTAVVSGMDEEEFHEAGEGLGIMARLPERPGAANAANLLAALKRIAGI